MKVRDIMTTAVATVTADASVQDAVAAMLQRRVSGLPVVDAEGRLVGMLTEGDFLRRAEIGTAPPSRRWLQALLSPGREAVRYSREQGRRVSEVMTAPAITTDPDATLRDVVDLMARHAVKRVPVVAEGRLLGIVSRSDLLRALDRSYRARPAPRSRSDEEVRADILAEFGRVPCIPSAMIGVAVAGGVVDLTGSILDERERDAVRVAVENTEGVKSVRDHLLWVEPMSGMAMASPDDRATDPGAGRAWS